MVPNLTTHSLSMSTEDQELHWEMLQGSKHTSVIQESDSCLPRGGQGGYKGGTLEINSNVWGFEDMPIQIHGNPF